MTSPAGPGSSGRLEGYLQGLAGVLEVMAPTASAAASHVNSAVQHAFTPDLEDTQAVVRAGQFVVATHDELARANQAVRTLEGPLERVGNGLQVAAAAATHQRDAGVCCAPAAVDQQPLPAARKTAGAAHERRTTPPARGSGPGQGPRR
ncbi:hypothetical protein [Segeticoccus rhizosphaerae]|uniref:hypothetical protein n=1 Tax=Segeticoccus rhizosphaerae TaxID=1104777 RepID=UPI0012657811|nr:hypothetical protein [Segeticoccus rhizosphaerae]